MACYGRDKTAIYGKDDAFPRMNEPIALSGRHAVHPDRGILPPIPDGL